MFPVSTRRLGCVSVSIEGLLVIKREAEEGSEGIAPAYTDAIAEEKYVTSSAKAITPMGMSPSGDEIT